MVVDVLFPVALPYCLSYLMAKEAAERAAVGVFVRAPIGNRTFLGIIVAIRHPSPETSEQRSDVGKLKYIVLVEDHLMAISPKRIELWKWISEYYLCTLGEVMKASLPVKPPRQPKGNANPAPSTPLAAPPSLTPAQTQTLTSIQELMNLNGVILLKEVQGRTHIYLHLVRQILLSGKHVLLLTPEIGAGDQLFRQYKEYLEHRVCLLHSRLTPLQRQKVIQRIAQQQESILVIGMRSALLLADMQNFGLIIIEDEHDFSYKQIDPAPRFHAKDLALYIGKHYQIPVILSSTCPSLESEYNMRSGKFKSISPQTTPMSKPIVEIVDTLRLKKKKQMSGPFSLPLLQAIEQSVATGKQALFFSLRNAHLQDELHRLLPDVRTARLDESHHPEALQGVITRFNSAEIDILFGVRTVYQSVDWGDVGLVAIFDADRQLSRSDFRAHERAFQTLMTILGNIHTLLPDTPPRLILQTEQPDHPFYDHVQSNNSEHFVLEQLNERKTYQYPPFVRLIALRFKHPNPEEALHAAQHFKQELSTWGINPITGPFTPWQSQETKWHTQLLWIHLSRQAHSEALKRKIYEKTTMFKFPKGLIQVDVDPY